jgi:DNA-directed RNA polymerase subunit K/omega
MVRRPAASSAFEFSVVAGLRVAQLTRGCVPRVVAAHKLTTTAQLEVAAGKIVRVDHLKPLFSIP